MKASLVGAGPGDPGLLTLRGLELIREADVIIYDALVNPALLKFARKDSRHIYVGKIADKHAMPQEDINALIADYASQNAKVVRLKGGDPYIFGRGGEEAEYLADREIAFEEVPGISSAVAAPAYAGIPLTHRDFTSAITIVTGHENPEKNISAINWESLAQSGATLVFVMGVRNLPNISARLIKAGMSPDTPAAIIYRGTTPMQRSLFATLSTLPDLARKNEFANPSVIVVGKVVRLHEKLDWVKEKPLLGRRIVVTRAREQASEMVSMLSRAGAEVIEFPGIAIRSLPDYAEVDKAIEKLDKYSWLIFTSVNGVRFFWERLDAAGKDSRSLRTAKVAAIGPATAKALLERGIKADLLPSSYVAEKVAEAIIRHEGEKLAGMHILLPRAAEARMVLPETLANAGALIDVAPVYEAIPATDKAEEIRKLIEEDQIDCISFGSSSTVRNFLGAVSADLLRKHPAIALAAIGPITAETLRKNGLLPDIEPNHYTIPALLEAIEKYFSVKLET